MNFNFQVNSKAKAKVKAACSLFVPFLVGGTYINTQMKINSAKCHEDAPETEMPVNLFDGEDPEFEQLQEILNDPNIDPEMYKEIMMESKNIGIQPLKFSQMHGQVKHDFDDDCWKGLRLNINWKPTQMFNTETILDIDGKSKALSKYRLSATTMIPSKL